MHAHAHVKQEQQRPCARPEKYTCLRRHQQPTGCNPLTVQKRHMPCIGSAETSCRGMMRVQRCTLGRQYVIADIATCATKTHTSHHVKVDLLPRCTISKKCTQRDNYMRIHKCPFQTAAAPAALRGSYATHNSGQAGINVLQRLLFQCQKRSGAHASVIRRLLPSSMRQAAASFEGNFHPQLQTAHLLTGRAACQPPTLPNAFSTASRSKQQQACSHDSAPSCKARRSIPVLRIVPLGCRQQLPDAE